jgi:hypothetical protein
MQAFQTVEPVATEKEIACASLCSVRISQSLGAEAGWLAGYLAWTTLTTGLPDGYRHDVI